MHSLKLEWIIMDITIKQKITPDHFCNGLNQTIDKPFIFFGSEAKRKNILTRSGISNCL